MQTRVFGRTGANLPFLGLGCQRLVDTSGCSEGVALQIIETAIERGVRYFDTAWVYGLGQAEERLGRVAASHRPAMWISTKTVERRRDGALRQLEESLTRLRTDHVDEWRLHNLTTLGDVDQCFGPGGAAEALLQAKEQGMIRCASVSAHASPRVLIEALARFPFDSLMFPGSVLDRFIHSFEERLLPQANAEGVATVAMKALALGKLSHLTRQALRYTLGLPVSLVVVGCSKLAELEHDLRVAEEFTPLSESERQAFFAQVEPLVTPRNVPWKAVDWGKTGEWIELGSTP